MQFGPWYPLAEARDRTPAAEGIVQVRRAQGLVDYPRGKSAMVHYAHAPDAQAAAVAWAAAHGSEGLLCRHLIDIDADADLMAFYTRLSDEFGRRFGALPRFER